jgi:Flp pilus assembly protein TadG
MQVMFAIGILSFTGLVLLCFDWGVPNAAERLGIALVAYARNARRRQQQRARRQEEQLAHFLEREVA